MIFREYAEIVQYSVEQAAVLCVEGQLQCRKRLACINLIFSVPVPKFYLIASVEHKIYSIEFQKCCKGNKRHTESLKSGFVGSKDMNSS